MVHPKNTAKKKKKGKRKMNSHVYVRQVVHACNPSYLED
jgi:hypothetical protein